VLGLGRNGYAAALVTVLALGLGHASLYVLPFEDAYISFRYAESLADGQGLSYNPGQRVEGCSSIGWVAVLAAARRLGLPVPATAQALALAAGLGLIFVAVRMATAWTKRPWVGLAVGAWIAAHGTLAYYAGSGMETTLFALLVNAGMLAATSSKPRASWLCGVLLALGATVRPEGAGYFVAVAAALGTTRQQRAKALPVIGAFALLFVPYFLWRWNYFGYPFPNTFYAKARVGGAGLVTGLEQVERFATLHLGWLAPVGVVLIARARGMSGWLWLVAAVVAAAAANVVAVGGDSFAFYRFFLPAIPAAGIAILFAAKLVLPAAARRLGWSPESLPRIAAGSLALLVAWTFGQAWLPRVSLVGETEPPNRTVVLGVDRINAEYFAVGRWLRESFPPDTTIATNAAGIVPYESRLRTIDMLGLNDAHIAHRAVSGRGALGHQKHDAGYVLAQRPAVIFPALPRVFPRQLHGLELMRWYESWFGSLPGDAELFGQPELFDDFMLVTVPIAEQGWVAFFLRKDAPKPPGLASERPDVIHLR
jgi:arabinofuranosyltransferase